MDANIDPTYTQVGPHVIGRRQTIPKPERDNAIYLTDFLEAHGCFLPQTVSDLPFRKRATYKEMTCIDHSLLTDDVHQWTILDYLIVPQALRQTVTLAGSIFQQFMNTRHLPLVFRPSTYKNLLPRVEIDTTTRRSAHFIIMSRRPSLR